MDDVYVFFIPMPSGVHGCVTPNADGSYTIFINCNDSAEQQRKTFYHELKHIKGEDFGKDVQFVEWRAS